eukprot:CAMPEP_0206506626 /NCGR_PEP_ID=MMETSP0324_2-20121206/56878_1 /ASSEMBLY_ACC=CAM_ASM_000836 /TAXON_ID=2866 /ORGANISM="Crypthecodinium cohnii, Strain Seligo" /LENGTH=785 /DNA_ID=CAMNT_0053996393 /DNA_START=20 /DNA_END=2374 /DNA_ORIENTATION=+
MESKVLKGRGPDKSGSADGCDEDELHSEGEVMQGTVTSDALDEATSLLDATLELLESFPDGTILGSPASGDSSSEGEGEGEGREGTADDEVVVLDSVEEEPEVADEEQLESPSETYPEMLTGLLEFLPTLPVSLYRQEGTGDWNYKRITRDFDYVVSALHDEVTKEERFIPARLDAWEKVLEDHIRRRPKGQRLDNEGACASGLGRRVEGLDPKRYDNEGRPFDFTTIVVNFANVGTTFGKKFVGNNNFHWEGVRRCLKALKEEWNFKSCVGIVLENWRALDGFPNSTQVFGVPDDIQAMCDTIEETPRISDAFHKSADDEMTIKCAYRRNCLFLDNDNYRDWQAGLLSFAKAREWLVSCKEIVHMRYYFDQGVGTFELLQGLVARSTSSTTGEKIAAIRRGPPKAKTGAKSTSSRSALSPNLPPAPPAPSAPDSQEQHRVQKALLQQCFAPRETPQPKKPPPMNGRSSQSTTVDLLDDKSETGGGGGGASSSTANVNAHIQGWTPLCAAVSEGTEHVVASLLNQKADPNIPTSFGVVPIFCAVRNWRPRIIRWLLRAGARVSQARGPDGETLEQALREKLGKGPAASKAVYDNWTLLRSLRLNVDDLLLPKDRAALQRWKASQPVDLTKSSHHRHGSHQKRRHRPEGALDVEAATKQRQVSNDPELVDLTQPSVRKRKSAGQVPVQDVEATDLTSRKARSRAPNFSADLLPDPCSEQLGSGSPPLLHESVDDEEEAEKEDTESWANLQSALQEAAKNFKANGNASGRGDAEAEADSTAFSEDGK